MIVIFFRTLGCFFIAVLTAALGLKKYNKKLYYSGISLNRLTFRLPENSRNDIFIIFRLYKRIMTSIFNSRIAVKFISDNPVAIFDNSSKSKELRIDYVEKLAGDKIGVFTGKDKLLGYINFQQATVDFVFLVITIIPLFLLSACNRDKSKYPLLAIEFLECFHLVLLFKNNNIHKVHYFCIYERDANICAYVLMKHGIFVNKIPSEVPLFFWNKIIVSDSLSICFKYQEEELSFFKDTMFINKLEHWVPENAFLAPARYYKRGKNNINNTIGFYSSANWLREYKGDVDLGENGKINEELLLKYLIDYVNLNKQLSLVIYRHPLEKQKQFLELSQKYYADKVNGSTILLAETEKRSADYFDEVELAVALYSTVLFERIFFGFKTLLMPLGHNDFFTNSSSFSSICAKNREELYQKITANLAISNEEYFIKNELVNYSVDAYISYFR